MTKACLLIGLSAAFVAGCGSSSGSTSSSNSGPTSSATVATPGFVANANAACRTDALAVLAASRSFTGGAAAAARLVAVYREADSAEVATLRQLTPPSNAKSAFDAFLADRAKIVGDDQKGETAARHNDGKAYVAAQQDVHALGKDARQQAGSAGLQICAERLSAADASAIKKVVVDGSVHPTASLCTTWVTKHYLTVTFRGNLAECEKQIVRNPARSAEVTQLYGILPEATADISQQGTSPPRQELSLLKENGRWKVDQVVALP